MRWEKTEPKSLKADAVSSEVGPQARQAAVGPGGSAGSTRCLWMEVSEGSWESHLFTALGFLVYASFQDFFFLHHGKAELKDILSAKETLRVTKSWGC